MGVLKNAEREGGTNTFEYKDKIYHLAYEGERVIAIEKDKLPENLARVVPDNPLSFDENDILKPLASNNDMVSLSTLDEWEKFARFRPHEKFKVLIVAVANLVGPTYLYTQTILQNGEILALVTKQSIVGEKRYGWQKAEENYDYGEEAYINSTYRDAYKKWVVNPKRGFKPVEL